MITIIATILFAVALAVIIGVCLANKEGEIQMPVEKKPAKKAVKAVKKAVATKAKKSTKKTK